MRIVLIGPPAAGKSRIGKRLARRLEIAYIDTDAVIVRDNGPIADIFAAHGEAHFRALERVAVHDALQQHGVISLGGGAVLDTATQQELAELPVVLLTVAAEAVTERIANGKRPLVKDVDSWQKLVDARLPLYTSLATYTTDTTHRPTTQVVDELEAWAGSLVKGPLRP